MALQSLADESVHEKNNRVKMKIGILTFHRAHNYGAVLQCYALQEILKRRGHQVQVIDYRQPWIEEFYRFISPDMLRRAGSPSEVLAYIKKNLKKFLLAPLRSRHFASFRNMYLDLSVPCDQKMIPDYDCYVIGSDQLWSLHCLGGESDEVYFGRFRHGSKSRVIGYAISADMKSVETLKDELPLLVSGFDALSMREKETAEKVALYSSMHCDVCLDPTLLTDKSLWEPVINNKWKRRRYVLIYEVRWKKEDKGRLRRMAEKIASKIGDGCEVIDLSRVNHSVSDFISLFRYAAYVVTTSFHGTVFSILFQRPFYVMPLWNGYDLRYMELLGNLGAADRVVNDGDDPLPADVDFVQISSRLSVLRESSFDFLERNI